MHTSINIVTRQNKGRSKLAVKTICEQCHQQITSGQKYTVHGVRTDSMPVPSFSYYHADHAPAIGSGWGQFQIGEPVTSPTQVKVGDLLLQYNAQFDAYNVVKVTQTHWEGAAPANARRKMWGMFVNPADTAKPRQGGDEVFCIGDHEIGHTCRLYRAVHVAC